MAKPASAMGALIKKQQEANKYIDQGQKLGTPDIRPKSGMLTVPWKEESRTTGSISFNLCSMLLEVALVAWEELQSCHLLARQ